jgi:hypothetical protein
MFQHPVLFLFTQDNENANLLFFSDHTSFYINKIAQRDPLWALSLLEIFIDREHR